MAEFYLGGIPEDQRRVVPESDYIDNPVVTSVLNEMNSEDYTGLITRLRGGVEQGADTLVEHAVLTEPGQRLRSNGEAVLQIVQFAHGAWDNVLLATEAQRRAAREAGFHDDQGDPLPWILMAGHNPETPVDFTDDELDKIRSGDLGPIASRQLDAVENLPDSLHVHGFSNGANLVLPVAADAVEEKSKNILGVSIDEQTQSEARWPFPGFLRDFIIIDGLRFTFSDSKNTGFVLPKDALKSVQGQFNASLVTKPNRATLRGMGKPVFEHELNDALSAEDQDFPIDISVGGKSAVGSPHQTVDIVARAIDANPDASDRLSLTLYPDMGHGWSDRMPTRIDNTLHALGRAASV